MRFFSTVAYGVRKNNVNVNRVPVKLFFAPRKEGKMKKRRGREFK